MSLDEIIAASRTARRPGLIARATAIRDNTAMSEIERRTIQLQLETEVGALRRLPGK